MSHHIIVYGKKGYFEWEVNDLAQGKELAQRLVNTCGEAVERVEVHETLTDLGDVTKVRYTYP